MLRNAMGVVNVMDKKRDKLNKGTVVPAASGHLRFGAKVTPRGRWLPDTGTLTWQRQ